MKHVVLIHQPSPFDPKSLPTEEREATDGRYVNAAGAVGGYLVSNAATREEAIALAARMPAARLGSAVEVRPAAACW